MKKKALQIPENVVAFGQPEGEAVKLYIQQGIFKSLLTMPGSSILLGRYEQVEKETRLVISEYLEAEELSAETWEETKAAVAEAYKDLEILGWHYGNYDGAEELPEAVSALQSEIFNLQHQVLFLVDARGKARKFCRWGDNRVEKLAGYYLYDQEGESIRLTAPHVPAVEEEFEDAQEAYTRRKNSGTVAALSICIALLGAIAIFLLFFTVKLNDKYNAQMEKQEELIEKLDRQQADIDSLNEQVSYLTELDYSQNNALVTLQQLFNEESTHNHSAVTWATHTVKAGDTLQSICEANGMDYETSLELVLAINGLEKAEDIKEGRLLLLPIVK